MLPFLSLQKKEPTEQLKEGLHGRQLEEFKLRPETTSSWGSSRGGMAIRRDEMLPKGGAG